MKVSDQQLNNAVKSSFSYREVIRKCGISLNSGSTYNHYKNRINTLQLDVSHFRGKGNNFGHLHVGGHEKLHWSEILRKGKSKERMHSRKLRRAYLEYCAEKNIDYQCCGCQNTGLWRDEKMKLQISHKDDDRSNNIPNNLEWICPNCHTIK